MSSWTEIKKEYWYPGDPVCWVCRVNMASDLHHWLPKGLVSKKQKKHIDSIENAVPLCKDCHAVAHDQATRNKLYSFKCYELGKERIDEWLELLDLKIGVLNADIQTTDQNADTILPQAKD